MKFSVLIGVLIVLSVTLFSGCRRVPPPPPSEKVETPLFIDHKVQFSGETLAFIAKWYTGNAENWKHIISVNPGLRPERIVIGQIIKIPYSMAQKKQGFTKAEFVKMVGVIAPQKPVVPDEATPSANGDAANTASGGASSASGVQQDSSKNQPANGDSQAEAAKKRQELQEKTRYEILRQMLKDDTLPGK